MKQARQAPVFKPLSNAENTPFFNFESQSSHARTSAPVPFMRTNENQVTSAQNKLIQHQDVGSERLSSLHAKLHQEADKIRKWKVQTEIELKQKEKKIQEASTTNESLRKSILELQLQNEDLSLKLQEEMGNREDVIQRINSTRQLCGILKDHATKLEEKLHQCETERTELKYLEKEHLQQFEELSSQFKKLETTSVDNQNKLVNQLHLERDDRRTLEEELESKLSEAEVQLKALMDQCDEKDIEIRDVRTMLQRNDEKIHTLEQSIATLQERSDRQISDIQSKQCDLEVTSQQLLCTQKEKLQYEEKLTEISVMLENLKMEKSTVEQSMVSSNAEYDAKLVALQQQCEELNHNILSEKEKVRKYEEQLAEMSMMSENLKSSRDILTLENTKLEGTVAALNKDVTECRKRIDEQTEDHRQLRAELDESRTLAEQIQKSLELEKNNVQQKHEENRSLQDQIHDLEVMLKQKEEVIQTALTQCETAEGQLQISKAKNEELQLVIEEEKEKVKQTLNSLDLVNEEMAVKSRQMTSQDCSINKMKKDYEKLQKELQKTRDDNETLKNNLMKIESENEQLILKSEELQNLLDDLKEEKAENDKSLDSVMKSKSKQVSDMESKHKDLKAEMTSKNKQIKELEKEIKGLKSKLTSQTKATEAKSKEYMELREEMEMMKLSNDNIQSDLLSLNEQLQTAKSSEKDALKQMEEMKAKCERSVKEMKQTEEKCEFQLSEMMATMEKYKNENNKIVQQKEKELELLKTKSDEFSTLKQKKDSQYEEMKKSSENLKTSLEEALSEKNELLTSLSNQGETLASLEKKIVLKEAEVAQLQGSVKSLRKELKQKKKMSTSQTQTSPASSPVPRVNYKPATTPQVPNSEMSASDNENAQTPQNCLKTPQRSILRNVNSVSKRRKVVFASHDDSGRHSASDVDSDSSSELMEVEMESVESRYKTNVKSTPLVIRPSPKVRPSPKAVTPDIRTDTYQKTPLTRIPRGPPVKLKDKEQRLKTGPVIDEEKEMFHKLFPHRQNEMVADKENKMKKTEQDTHVRKTPSKSTSKFFKASPKERISKKGKHSGKDEIAWFDLDSVFGFGPED